MNQTAAPNRMFSLSSIDAVFSCLPSNEGSFLTLDEAIAWAEASKRRCPSRHSFAIHENPLGQGYIDYSNIVLALTGPLGPRRR